MHPNRAFRFADDAAMLAWADARGFAHIFAGTAAGPMVVHGPIVAEGAQAVRFHVARANRIMPFLDGARVLVSIAGPDGYISPSWYEDPVPHVPTWNYIAVEIEGACRVLSDDDLIDHLDVLAARHEPRVSPDAPWTRAKMDPVRFDKMRTAIIGFEVAVEVIRGTTKLSQNKSATDIAGVIAGLGRSDNRALAEAMAR